MRCSATGTVLRAGVAAVSFVISQISAGARRTARAERYPRPDVSYTTWWLIEITRRRGREYVRKSKPADVQWVDKPEGRSLDETEDDDKSRSGSAVRRAEGTSDRATPRRGGHGMIPRGPAGMPGWTAKPGSHAQGAA